MGSKNSECRLVTRAFDLSKDYGIIQEWWKQHGSFAPKPEHLSSTGLLIEADDPLCAGWLYNTDSKICVFEFVVSNPNVNKDLRDAALTLLIEEIKKLACQRGYELIYSSVKGIKYISRLQAAGFVIADEDQTHCFCEAQNV